MSYDHSNEEMKCFSRIKYLIFSGIFRPTSRPSPSRPSKSRTQLLTFKTWALKLKVLPSRRKRIEGFIYYFFLSTKCHFCFQLEPSPSFSLWEVIKFLHPCLNLIFFYDPRPLPPVGRYHVTHAEWGKAITSGSAGPASPDQTGQTSFNIFLKYFIVISNVYSSY